MAMRFLAPIVILLLAGCLGSAGVRETSGPTPADLSRAADPAVKGRAFTWGGTIASVKNLADRTLVEVIAYPLDGSAEPDVGGQSTERFLADKAGFLEPVEYQPGRRLTVTGPLLGYRDGKVGEQNYRYPVLQASELTLWPVDRTEPFRQPSVGVGIGFGSGGYRNIGIGIGF